jgi:hypothetical protein
MTTHLQRQNLCLKIEKKFKQIVPHGVRPQAACLFWALAAATVIRAAGIRAWLQAGSLSWSGVEYRPNRAALQDPQR